MMAKTFWVSLFLISVLFCSCSDSSKGKRARVFNKTYTSSEKEVEKPSEEQKSNTFAQSGEDIAIPFRVEGGVKYVNVKVNGVGLEMIFDTGCSSTLISISEAKYLYEKGKLTEDDLLGTVKSQIADGSIVENRKVNLKEVIIDDKILCRNVTATVSNNIAAPLLLGNEVLDRTATITIDNESNNLYFKIK